MVASWVGPLAPTSSPSDTWRAVTMPSKGAFTSVYPRLSPACAVSTSACLSRARAASRLAVALSSACFDATWRLASSACRSYSASVCFNVAWAPASAARACSSLSLYGSGSMTKRVAPSFTWSPSLLLIFCKKPCTRATRLVVYRRGITGGLEIAGDLLLHRHRHRDLGRRRRHIAVLLPAGAEHQPEGGCRASGKPQTCSRRPINRHRATSTPIVEDLRTPQRVARPRGAKVRSRV